MSEIQTEVYIKLNNIHLQTCLKVKNIIDRQRKHLQNNQQYNMKVIGMILF